MLKTLFSNTKGFRIPSALTPVFMVGEVICDMIIPVLMGLIVDRGIYGGNLNYIIITGMKMVLVAGAGLCMGILGGVLGAKASAGFARNLRKSMHDRIQSFSFSNIDGFSASSLITRLTTDVSNVQNSYQMMLRMAVRAPMSMVIAMFMSFMLSPRIASIYLMAVLFLAIVMTVMLMSTVKYFTQIFRKYDELNESVQENIQGMRVVKAYVREDHEIGKFKKAALNVYIMFLKAEIRIAFVSPLLMGTIYACMLIISWLGARMIVRGALTTGTLLSLLTYCMNIMMSLMMLSAVVVMITMSSASARRIVEVISEKPSIANPENPVMEIKDGSIEFDHVSFCYSEGGDAQKAVLDDISFKVGSGEMIGIIGATGSGKSSLVSLISRLYEVSEGCVKVGGVDVRDYDLKKLRGGVSVVLQKNILFSGTIYENLRWGDPAASDEECREACRIACVDEFIESLPDGYETRIEQGGANVSGGQRQRLCIARALLMKPRILILDDVTSAVDTSTEANIRRALEESLPQTTKLMISQRISSVQDCDRILVLDHGRLNGFDTHENLLAGNSIYREIHASQMGLGDARADFDSKG